MAHHISIIIPVFNNSTGLERTLKAISKQQVNPNTYETIVIDNGSENPPIEICQKYNTIYIEEHTYLNSPYSARNRGFERSTGDILVLIDATCAPEQGWLQAGIRKLDEGADLVAGDVKFHLTEASTLPEFYDSFINIQMQRSVNKNNVAKTTNLFFTKHVLQKIGPFPEGLRSGGDVRWTGLAVRSGLTLTFSRHAQVFMQPRGYKGLLKKCYRVAKGQPQIWRENNTFFRNFIKKTVLSFLPPNPINIIKKTKNVKDIHNFTIREIALLTLIGYSLRLTTGVGNIRGIFLRDNEIPKRDDKDVSPKSTYH